LKSYFILDIVYRALIFISMTLGVRTHRRNSVHLFLLVFLSPVNAVLTRGKFLFILTENCIVQKEKNFSGKPALNNI